MRKSKRTKVKSAKKATSKSAKKAVSRPAKKAASKSSKRARASLQRSKPGPDLATHSGTQILRVLQERLQPGHWANADQLQRWLLEDAVAKLVRAGYLEKFGEDGMGLTETGRAHKGPVRDLRQE